MALTAEVLFVNADYLKRITNLNGSVETSLIVPAVILAQDKFIQSYIGTDLLNYLKTNVATLSGVYETLMDTYVRKATAWWTMVELIPNMYVRLDNGGLVIRSSENTIQITEGDLHREIENARQNAQFYTERLVSYLTKNSSSFPEYRSNQYPDMHPEKIAYSQNGMTISRGRDYYKDMCNKACVLDNCNC